MQHDNLNPSHLAAYLEALGRLGDPQAVPALLYSLRHNSSLIRQVAATSLGHIAQADAVPGLLEALTDPEPRVAQAAAWALGQIGDKRATGGLLEALQASHPHTRRAAAWSLTRLGDKRALPGLESALQDADEKVRRAAGGAAQVINEVQDTAADSTDSAARTSSRPRKRASQLVSVLLALSLMVTTAALLATILAWNRSLGPELVALEPSAGMVPAEALPTPAGEPACGGPSVMMLMLVGSDAPSSDYAAGFADVIRMARIDFVSQEVTLLAVPRDLWVTIPGLENYGVVGNRVKTAFTYGNHYGVPGGGPSLLAQTLEFNFGLYVDHYVIISFAAFEAGIDALGGIDLYLAEPVQSEKPGEQAFLAGWQHMDGKTALAFARFRPDNSSDLARIDRQTQVIAAVQQKVLSTQNLAVLPSLVAQLQNSILTDLSPSDISGLMCLGRQIEAGNIYTINMGGDRVIATTDEYGYERLLPNSEAIRQLVRDFNAARLSP